MPRIPVYEGAVSSQGGLNVQANPMDFGAQMGAATQRLGGAVEQAADTIYQYEETKDVTNVHVNLAKARAEWTQALRDRAREAQPGDDSFARGIMGDVAKWAEGSAASAATRKGQALYRSMAANLAMEMGQRAIAIQADLDSKAAVTATDEAVKSAGATAYNDHTQVDTLHEQGRQMFNMPESIWGKVDRATRERLEKAYHEAVDYNAAVGFAKRNPMATLDSMSPEVRALFKPWENLLKQGASAGATVKLKPETMAQAEVVIPQASAAGLNANAVMGVIDATGADAKTVIQKLGALLPQFGGDYTKALAAYQYGAQNVKATIQATGSEWAANMPEETQGFVRSVMESSGMVAPAEQPVGAPPAEPVAQARQAQPSSIGFLARLSGEQQARILGEAVSAADIRLQMDAHARNEKKIREQEAVDAAMDGFVRQIFDPKKYGAFSLDAVLASTVLGHREKKDLQGLAFTRQQQILSQSDSARNPGEVRRLELLMHAPDTDPTKVYSLEPITESFRQGRISVNEFRMLSNDFYGLKDGAGNTFQQRLHSAVNGADIRFKRSIQGVTNPNLAVTALDNYRAELFQKVEELRAQGKNPAVLLDPKSPESMVDPAKVMGYLQETAGQAMAQAAQAQVKAEAAKGPGMLSVVFGRGLSVAGLASSAAKGAAKPPVVPGALPTFKEYESLKSGDQFTDPDGNVRRKP